MVAIDKITEYKGSRNKDGQVGYRFNVLLAFPESESVLICGLRTIGGRIYPPGAINGRRFFPIARFDKRSAKKIYERVKEFEDVGAFPEAEPLLSYEKAVKYLEYTPTDLVESMPSTIKMTLQPGAKKPLTTTNEAC